MRSPRSRKRPSCTRREKPSTVIQAPAANESTARGSRSAARNAAPSDPTAAAAAARAAAEAAGKPKPMTDREYLLLVAAAKSEAENAAIKKAAEDKAKQDADKAAAEAEKAATALSDELFA